MAMHVICRWVYICEMTCQVFIFYQILVLNILVQLRWSERLKVLYALLNLWLFDNWTLFTLCLVNFWCSKQGNGLSRKTGTILSLQDLSYAPKSCPGTVTTVSWGHWININQSLKALFSLCSVTCLLFAWLWLLM